VSSIKEPLKNVRLRPGGGPGGIFCEAPGEERRRKEVRQAA
jgi:hypothetical protein